MKKKPLKCHPFWMLSDPLDSQFIWAPLFLCSIVGLLGQSSCTRAKLSPRLRPMMKTMEPALSRRHGPPERSLQQHPAPRPRGPRGPFSAACAKIYSLRLELTLIFTTQCRRKMTFREVMARVWSGAINCKFTLPLMQVTLFRGCMLNSPSHVRCYIDASIASNDGRLQERTAGLGISIYDLGTRLKLFMSTQTKNCSSVLMVESIPFRWLLRYVTRWVSSRLCSSRIAKL